jgi:hypothetical protein
MCSFQGSFINCLLSVSRVQLKCDGTWKCRGGKVKGKLGEWRGYPVLFTLPQNMVYPALLPLMHTPWLPVVDWTDAPANLNGLIHFAERRTLVSVCVPSHFKRSLPTWQVPTQYELYEWPYLYFYFAWFGDLRARYKHFQRHFSGSMWWFFTLLTKIFFRT